MWKLCTFANNFFLIRFNMLNFLLKCLIFLLCLYLLCIVIFLGVCLYIGFFG